MKLPDGTYRKNIFMVPSANADGGIESTVLDMLKFDQALYGDQLVSAEYKKKMFTPNLNEYGYCWRIAKSHGHRVIGHGGGAPGINALFSRYVDDGYTLIVMSNYDRGASPIARTLEAALFGAPYEMPKPALGEFLVSFLQQYGRKKLVAEWDRIMQKNGYELDNSNMLNNIGYSLLNSRMFDEAIVLFEQNVRLFPDEANPHDSLAEAYLMKGERDIAIRHYKKALEIDPNFSSSKTALEKLIN
jgi:tetratricopeptide (TPR) repeat protein